MYILVIIVAYANKNIHGSAASLTYSGSNPAALPSYSKHHRERV
jgi:hypothetical protein